MPSLKQVNINNEPLQDKEKKKSKIIAVLKWILVIMFAVGWFIYRDMPKVVRISEEAWEARSQSQFKELFDTQMKKIIWFGPVTCPFSEQKKQIIGNAMQYMGLDKYYIQRPFLQNSLSVRCEKNDCIDMLILKHCSDYFCIIIPRLKTIISTKRENLFRDAEKYKKY